MVEIFATLSSSKRQTARSRTSTGLPVALTPHMNRYAFRAKHVVLRLYRELSKSPMVGAEGQARQPLLYPAFRSGRAYQHPIGSDVLAE
jgi:hypothetical protein